MCSPTKPWELSNPLRQRPGSHSVTSPRIPFPGGDFPRRFRVGDGNPEQRIGHFNGLKMSNCDERQPPPIPPRQNSGRSMLPYSGISGPYGSGYGGYGFGNSYGGYSMGNYGNSFGPYGPYSNVGPYNRNSSIPPGNALIRRAEETSRPAFESIESIVHAFGSITMMLESTFFAVHNSFRAVLGVAEQFNNLKLNLLNTVGAFALWRFFKQWYRRLLVLLGLRTKSVADEVWSDVSNDVARMEARKGAKSWPVLMFFAVVFGTPWLIWKFLKTVVGSIQESDDTWMTGEGDHYVGEVEYDFQARSEDELDCQNGSTVLIAPKDKQPDVRGWLLATVDGKVAGLVPANYIKGIRRRYSQSRSSGSSNTAQENKSAANLGTVYEEITTNSNDSQ